MVDFLAKQSTEMSFPSFALHTPLFLSSNHQILSSSIVKFSVLFQVLFYILFKMFTAIKIDGFLELDGIEACLQNLRGISTPKR